MYTAVTLTSLRVRGVSFPTNKGVSYTKLVFSLTLTLKIYYYYIYYYYNTRESYYMEKDEKIHSH